MESLFVTDLRTRITSERDVELASAVHPIEPVVAGAVQIDHASGTGHKQARSTFANLIITLLRMRHLPKHLNHTVDVIANGSVRADQLLVLIGEHRFFETPFKTQGKEHRAPPDKWFKIGIDLVWQSSPNGLQELSFAACPF